MLNCIDEHMILPSANYNCFTPVQLWYDGSGWMTDELPSTIKEGIVQRRICFHLEKGNECQYSLPLLVSRCPGIYAYKL